MNRLKEITDSAIAKLDEQYPRGVSPECEEEWNVLQASISNEITALAAYDTARLAKDAAVDWRESAEEEYYDCESP